MDATGMEPARKIKLLLVFGTRPEAIKMAPLLQALANHPHFTARSCVTGQHTALLEPVLDCFNITPDIRLTLARNATDLAALTAQLLQQLHAVLQTEQPDMVLVHGDTTSALAAALAAFYQQIPIAHVEAGLRTHNLHAPWPEEGNRAMIARLAALHFAPTETAKQQLLQEAIPADGIHVTGNTVIDALKQMERRFMHQPALRTACETVCSFLRKNSRMVLITGHRRENFGGGFARICSALAALAARYPQVDFVYPVHLNPNVAGPVHAALGSIANLHLIPPQEYPTFLYLMQRAHFILTDSGGIQEEAPAFGTPVLVMRDVTERPEAIAAGTARLVGTRTDTILQEASRLLDDAAAHHAMQHAANPYGDGFASERILSALHAHFAQSPCLLAGHRTIQGIDS